MKTEPKLDGFSIVEPDEDLPSLDELKSAVQNCAQCSVKELCPEHCALLFEHPAVASQDQDEARLVTRAHSLVEQNLMEQEGHSYHRDNEAEPSAHEWVGSVTRRNEKQQNLLDAPETREEFLEPTYNLADRLSGYRFLGKHMIDLRDDYDVRLSLVPDKGFGICQACHMLYNQALATCPEC